MPVSLIQGYSQSQSVFYLVFSFSSLNGIVFTVNQSMSMQNFAKYQNTGAGCWNLRDSNDTLNSFTFVTTILIFASWLLDYKGKADFMLKG